MEYLREIDERIMASIVRSSDAGTDVGDLMKTYNSLLFTAGKPAKLPACQVATITFRENHIRSQSYYYETVLRALLSTQAADEIISP